jgi:hypothetical protein
MVIGVQAIKYAINSCKEIEIFIRLFQTFAHGLHFRNPHRYKLQYITG